MSSGDFQRRKPADMDTAEKAETGVAGALGSSKKAIGWDERTG